MGEKLVKMLGFCQNWILGQTFDFSNSVNWEINSLISLFYFPFFSDNFILELTKGTKIQDSWIFEISWLYFPFSRVKISWKSWDLFSHIFVSLVILLSDSFFFCLDVIIALFSNNVSSEILYFLRGFKVERERKKEFCSMGRFSQ